VLKAQIHRDGQRMTKKGDKKSEILKKETEIALFGEAQDAD